ncbi:hypothetical protein O6H91_04G088100 [Diphasiastrum complanatum]|uniref:Uncharacterized protein n=1 Tax=Diphasiastrum complanatum TaxID=34168 RepID=A0ACC2DYZ1_DIPCM|nr:hypothetical protein O6H91_04G088100 [Diphasiastrum complanatum]
MPRDSKNFRVFMAKETYWSQLIEKATWITSDLCAKDGISLSEGHVYYFTRMRDLHFNKDFSTLLPKVKSANPPEKQPEFSCTARRLVFRYCVCNMIKFYIVRLFFSMFYINLHAWPQVVADPCERQGFTCSSIHHFAMLKCLCSPVWAEIGVTPEEISLCPWWLEYPQGECHPSELHLFTNKGNVQASKTVAIEAPKFFEVGSTSNPKIKKGVVRKRAKTKRQLDLDATTETSSTQSGGGPHGTTPKALDICCMRANILRMACKKNCNASKDLEAFCICMSLL